MTLYYKYSIEEVLATNSIAMLYSSEILTPDNFDLYNLGYEKFSNVVKATGVNNTYVITNLSGKGFMYIVFLSPSDEIIGFTALESQINLDKYTISKITLNIEFKVTEEVIEVEAKVDYNIHINRTAEVHKELFNTGYDKRTTRISKLSNIKKAVTFCISDCQAFKNNSNSLMRYSGNYLTQKGMLEGYKFDIAKLSEFPEIISMYRDLSENIHVLARKDSTVADFDTSTGTITQLTISGTFKKAFGHLIVTDTTVYNVKENYEIKIPSWLLLAYDEKASTIYTFTKDSRFISGKLLKLLQKNDYSQSVAKLYSVSDSYLVYVDDYSTNIVSHEVRLNIKKKISHFIPITSKSFLIRYEDGTYQSIETYYKEESLSYELRITEDFGREYSNGTYYFKYIEQFAKKRYTNPFTQILLFSFEGSLFTRIENKLLSL